MKPTTEQLAAANEIYNQWAGGEYADREIDVPAIAQFLASREGELRAEIDRLRFSLGMFHVTDESLECVSHCMACEALGSSPAQPSGEAKPYRAEQKFAVYAQHQDWCQSQKPIHEDGPCDCAAPEKPL